MFASRAQPPHGPPPMPFAVDTLITARQRHECIERLAYQLAERRGFASGHALDDWLEAERRVKLACGLLEPEPRWDLEPLFTQ